MSVEAAARLAREGRLYPSVILYGATQERRQETAVELARVLLCEAAADARPCGRCRPCTRIGWPDGDSPDHFHPDFHVLARDRRTATSADATKAFLHNAYQAPFEASGQVFVIAEAESLSPEAADALLKILEEPPRRSPRHFLLLAATRRDLLPTLRSRSLSLFLGAEEPLDEDAVAAVTAPFGAAVDRYFARGAAVDLLLAAGALAEIDGYQDARARKPWATAAAAVLRHLGAGSHPPGERRALLAAASALLDAPRLRLRGIPHGRILEGLLSRHLAPRI